MKLVEYNNIVESKTFFIQDEEEEVGRVTYEKKLVISLNTNMVLTSSAKDTPILNVITVGSMVHHFTGETLVRAMLPQIEDALASHKFDNLTLSIKVDYLEDYERAGYEKIGYSEQDSRYLVRKRLY